MTTTAYPPHESPGADAARSIRRTVNDSIADIAGRLVDNEGEFEFLCECGDLACTGRINMTLEDYRRTAPGSVVDH